MNIYKFKNYPGAEQGSLASISSIPPFISVIFFLTVTLSPRVAESSWLIRELRKPDKFL